MITNPKYSYLDPTYPAYYWYFNRPKTLLYFSLRQFILILTIYDIIFSSIAVCFSLIYIIIDQLNHINLFQSNKFIEKLIHLPIGMLFDNRIMFQSSWTIDTISKNFPMLIYLHTILNGISLLCSINMFIAVKYYQPHRASFYLITKAAYFIHTTAIFTRWIVNNEKEIESMRIFYGEGDLGFFTGNINIFCLALFECLSKIFVMIMIFHSIQYLRDYCLHKELNCNNDNQSSIFLVISNNTFVNKKFNV